MSYSKKYRERAIECGQAGHSLEATRQIFQVSKSTIQKWRKQLEETGNLEKKVLHNVSHIENATTKLGLPTLAAIANALPVDCNS